MTFKCLSWLNCSFSSFLGLQATDLEVIVAKDHISPKESEVNTVCAHVQGKYLTSEAIVEVKCETQASGR